VDATLTVIFQDGFEINDFSAWTGVSGAPSVSDAQKRHGHYSALSDGANNEYCYKSFAASNSVSVRAYFYFGTLPTSGTSYEIIALEDDASWLGMALRNNAGQLQLSILDAAGTTWYNVALNAEQWYSIELKAINGANLEGFLNGVSFGSKAYGGSSKTAAYFGLLG
jgi:hypothetical protein